MYKTIFKIICCMVLCWVVCVPSFCQAVESMTPNESLEARQKMIAYSKQFVGVPYVYGGASKSGMDCSGLIFTIANDAIGVKLPRSTSGLYSTVRIIKDSEKEPGDLVFFKTVGSKISHVGLYMGNNQFIHAASDGPNTGVIISSLKESYWSSTYAGAGRFLPSIGEERIALVTEDSSSSTGTALSGESSQKGGLFVSSGSGSSDNASSSRTLGMDNGFLRKFAIDGTLTGDWTFFSAERFHLLFRGITVDAHARYRGKSELQPGFGISLSYDPEMKILQIPLLFSLTVAEGVRLYAGPVLTLGSPVEPGIDTGTPAKVKGSVFPGVLGLCLQTPTFKAGKVRLSLVQDIRYTVFNNMDNGALSIVDSLSAGLVFSTGIRVTFPMENFI
ncbi:MAG: C40 family peptidase [Treponema sp.]|nr:C40 family peptidase [Treponema sp.]